MQAKILRFPYIISISNFGQNREAMSYRRDIGSDSDYESEVDEIDPIVSHVSPSSFTHYQIMPIDIEVTASPVDLQRNPQMCLWKMQAQVTKHFKQNLAVTDRMRPGEKDLVGNLDRMLPLGFKIEMQANTFPYAVGMNIPGMMQNNVHRDGNCTYRLPPNLQAESTNKDIFDAENKVSRHAYENYRLCTKDDLEADIEFKPSRGNMDAHARIAVGSLAYETLTENLKMGHWQEENLTRQQVRNIFQPEDYTVQVTEKMGQDIREALMPEVERTAKSFINLSDFAITVHRADGVQGFATPKKIAGAINQVAGGKNTSTKINMDALNRNCTFYIKGSLAYLLF